MRRAMRRSSPSVAVTGNVLGASPAAASDGPAIIPIARGAGASIHSARSPVLTGAIAILPFSDRSAPSSTWSSNVAGSAPGFSTEMTILLVSRQSHAPPLGLNNSVGCPSAANTTCNRSSSRDAMNAFDISTTGPSSPLAAVSSARQQAAREALPQIAGRMPG